MDKVSSLQIDVEDTVDLLIKFDNGAKGRLHLDYLQRKYNCRLRLITSLGDLEWSFLPCRVGLNIGKDQSEVLYEGSNDVNEMYVEQTRYFLNCVKESKVPMNGVSEAFSLVDQIEKAKDLT